MDNSSPIQLAQLYFYRYFAIIIFQFLLQALIQLFVKYNSLVSSRASVERLFSPGKDIFRFKRTSLHDQSFNILMFMSMSTAE
jgi:hypothetical protein